VRPYITLLMDLGGPSVVCVAKEKKESPETSSRAEQEARETASRSDASTIQHGREQRFKSPSSYPRYALIIVGCSKNVYGVVRNREKARYAELLKLDDVLDGDSGRGSGRGGAILDWSSETGTFVWTGETACRMQVNEEVKVEGGSAR